MVLGYGLRDLKAHMNEIIKVTTTGYKYQMNYKKRGWSLFVCLFSCCCCCCFLFCHFALFSLTMISTTI